jgi:hypothetical protein
MAITNEWNDVERALAELEQIGAFRTAIPRLRRLVVGIWADKRLNDLEPSVSHASLVLRRRAPRSVWISPTASGGYSVSLVGPNLDFIETTPAEEDSVVEIVREYLAKAPLS